LGGKAIARGERARWLELKTPLARFGSGQANDVKAETVAMGQHVTKRSLWRTGPLRSRQAFFRHLFPVSLLTGRS
jgi:hypothetical protein